MSKLRDAQNAFETYITTNDPNTLASAKATLNQLNIPHGNLYWTDNGGQKYTIANNIPFQIQSSAITHRQRKSAEVEKHFSDYGLDRAAPKPEKSRPERPLTPSEQKEKDWGDALGKTYTTHNE